jgi:hypothetical protein
MSVMTDERVVLDEQTTTDKSEQAHIVMVPKGEKDQTPQAYVMRARVEGFPVTALCGYTWVPNKQATGLPVCGECKDIYDFDPFGKGRDDLPEE